MTCKKCLFVFKVNPALIHERSSTPFRMYSVLCSFVFIMITIMIATMIVATIITMILTMITTMIITMIMTATMTWIFFHGLNYLLWKQSIAQLFLGIRCIHFMATVYQLSFLMRCVVKEGPSVRASVRVSICPSVSHTRVETKQKSLFWPKLLSVRARTHLMPCFRVFKWLCQSVSNSFFSRA